MTACPACAALVLLMISLFMASAASWAPSVPMAESGSSVATVNAMRVRAYDRGADIVEADLVHDEGQTSVIADHVKAACWSFVMRASKSAKRDATLSSSLKVLAICSASRFVPA